MVLLPGNRERPPRAQLSTVSVAHPWHGLLHTYAIQVLSSRCVPMGHAIHLRRTASVTVSINAELATSETLDMSGSPAVEAVGVDCIPHTA
jgi:hypothetical protein